MLDGERISMNLTLFDAGAGDGAGGAAAGESTAALDAGAANGEKPGDPKSRAQRNPLANVQYGKRAADTGEEGGEAAAGALATGGTPERTQGEEPDTLVTGGDTQKRSADFEQLIKGEYKPEFDARVQKIISERFKNTKAMEARLDAVNPILSVLASKYGVKADDPAGLLEAIEEDSGFYEEEALQKGLTVEQLKAYKHMERENAELRRMHEDRARQEQVDRVYAEWMQQAEQTKGIYPGFDLNTEIQDPQFLSLLKAHVPVKTAYEVIHQQEILGGAMQYTAQQVTQKVVSGIEARGKRPLENGAGGQSAADLKTDVHKLTKADREEIARRVARGERISF